MVGSVCVKMKLSSRLGGENIIVVYGVEVCSSSNHDSEFCGVGDRIITNQWLALSVTRLQSSTRADSVLPNELMLVLLYCTSCTDIHLDFLESMIIQSQKLPGLD